MEGMHYLFIKACVGDCEPCTGKESEGPGKAIRKDSDPSKQFAFMQRNACYLYCNGYMLSSRLSSVPILNLLTFIKIL